MKRKSCPGTELASVKKVGTRGRTNKDQEGAASKVKGKQGKTPTGRKKSFKEERVIDLLCVILTEGV